MAQREHDDQPDAEAVTRVAEQVRDARDQVFRAYVRSREQARLLADAHQPPAPAARPRRGAPSDGAS